MLVWGPFSGTFFGCYIIELVLCTPTRVGGILLKKSVDLLQFKDWSYCWWLTNPATQPVEVGSEYPIIYKVLQYAFQVVIAGFLPSTVFTLPETNIAPESRPSQKETIVLKLTASKKKTLKIGE